MPELDFRNGNLVPPIRNVPSFRVTFKKGCLAAVRQFNLGLFQRGQPESPVWTRLSTVRPSVPVLCATIWSLCGCPQGPPLRG